MKNIYCEYCGGLINIETDDMCPSCGASFDKNKYLSEKRKIEKEKETLEQRRKALEVEERKEKLKRQQIENQSYQKRVNNMENAQKTTKRVAFLLVSPFIAFAVAFAIIILGGTILGITQLIQEETSIEEPVEETGPKYEYVKATAGFDDFADNGVIQVKIDKFEIFDPYPFSNEAGYASVAVHFIVENTVEEPIEDNSKVVALADGFLIERRNGYYEKYKSLKDIVIPPETKYDGYLLYKVPLAAETITIRYGDYITLEFPNPVKE